MLQLVLPQGWSAVVPYAPLAEDTWAIERPERRFDRPVGWLLMGRLGVLRERVAGVHVAIGAPVGNGMRRQDLLALLRWTLPVLRKIAPLPDRLSLVGAADPMWRGGTLGAAERLPAREPAADLRRLDEPGAARGRCT